MPRLHPLSAPQKLVNKGCGTGSAAGSTFRRRNGPHRRAPAQRLEARKLPRETPLLRRYFVSDAPGKFEKVGQRFLGEGHSWGQTRRHQPMAITSPCLDIRSSSKTASPAPMPSGIITAPRNFPARAQFSCAAHCRGKTPPKKGKICYRLYSVAEGPSGKLSGPWTISTQMKHCSLKRENPSAENIAVYIGHELKRRWRELRSPVGFRDGLGDVQRLAARYLP